MSGIVCPQCGAPVDPNATQCKYCGESLTPQVVRQVTGTPPVQPTPPPTYQNVYVQSPYGNPAINPAWPVKSKVAAGVLAIFLGGLGIHKFYLGKTGMGILYLVFCWTFIPEFIGFIEGIIYLCQSDENFMLKNHVRVG